MDGMAEPCPQRKGPQEGLLKQTLRPAMRRMWTPWRQLSWSWMRTRMRLCTR
jgi:hypothetical protein